MKFIQHNRSGEFNINYKKMVWMAEGETPTPKPDAKNPRWNLVNELGHGDKLESDVSKFEKLKAEKISGEKQDEQKDALLKRINDLVQEIDAFNAGKESQKYQEHKTTLEGLKRRVLAAEAKFNEAFAAIEAKKKEGTARIAEKAAGGAPAKTAPITVKLSDTIRVENKIEKVGTLTSLAEALYVEANSYLKNALPAVIGDSRYNVEITNTKLTVKIFDSGADANSEPKHIITLPMNAGRYVFRLADGAAGPAERRIKDPKLAIKGVVELTKKQLGKTPDQAVFQEILKVSGDDTGVDVVISSSKFEKEETPAEKLMNAANTKFNEKKYADAAKLYGDTAKEAQKEEGERYPIALMQQGKCYLQLNQNEKAYSSFADAVKASANRKLPELEKKAKNGQAIAAFNLQKYDEVKTLLSEDAEKADSYNAEVYKKIREDLQKMDDTKNLNSFENADGRKKVLIILGESGKLLEGIKNNVAPPSSLRADRKAQLNTEIDALLPLLKNSGYEKSGSLADLMKKFNLEGKEKDFIAKKDDTERATMISDALLKSAIARVNAQIPDLQGSPAPRASIPAIDTAEQEQAAIAERSALEARAQAERVAAAAKEKAAQSPDKKIFDDLNASDNGKILRDNDSLLKSENVDKQTVIEKFNALTTNDNQKINPAILLSKTPPREPTPIQRGEINTQQELFVRAIIRFQIQQKMERPDGILKKDQLSALMGTETVKAAAPVPEAPAPAKDEDKPAEDKPTAPKTRAEKAVDEPVDKIDAKMQQLLQKTLDNIVKGKLKGKVTREGFQQWINSDVLYEALHLKPDAPKLDINQLEDAILIVNRIKDAQKAFGMRLPASVQGIFGLKTYEKAINYRPAFKNILAEKGPPAADKPADEKPADETTPPTKELAAAEKLEAYKKANPESPEAVTDHELTGDLRESALAIGNRGAKSEYQVGDIVVYKVVSGAIYGANNYRKNGDNYATVKPMLSRLDGAQGDLGKFTVTESDVALVKPLVEINKGENAIVTASRETNPKFAEILTLIDTLKSNSSYPKASKYEYANDNLLSTLRLACEHAKDGKISSPINEPLSNYMAGLLMREGVEFQKNYPAMYPHIQAIVQDIITKAKPSEPAKPAAIPPAPPTQPKNDTPTETAPEVASGPSLMSEKNWKENEKTYVNESYEKKNTFYQIQNALAVSKRTGKPAELMSSALFSPVILDKGNAGKYEAIKVTYKGTDATTKLDKVEFSYGDKTFADLKSFVNYIAEHANITSFSKSSNEALKAQATRLAPQKEAIKDISDTMEGRLNALFNKEGRRNDVLGTAIRELKNAFDQSRNNRAPFEINSNRALFGTNIFAMENAHLMLEYKGENGKDTTLFIQNIDAKTKKPTDKVEVSGGLDGFIAKLLEIAKANGKFDAEKPAAVPTAAAPKTDEPLPASTKENVEAPDQEYTSLKSVADVLFRIAQDGSKDKNIDSPNKKEWSDYLIIELQLAAKAKGKNDINYHGSLANIASAQAHLGELDKSLGNYEIAKKFFEKKTDADSKIKLEKIKKAISIITEFIKTKK